MAKFIIEYDTCNVKKTLIIKGKEFVSNFRPSPDGGIEEDISFIEQIEQSNPEWVEDEMTYNELDQLDFADEDEIRSILFLIEEEIES